jgi:hypothetical protein
MPKYDRPSHCGDHLKDVNRFRYNGSKRKKENQNGLKRGISGAQPTRANHNLDCRRILGENYAEQCGDSLYAME